jgi:hypothetical protein
MKDAFGNELKVGDTIVYARRQSSSMWLTKTTIVGLGKRSSYSQGPIDTATVVNVNYKSIEDQKTEWEKSKLDDIKKIEELKAKGEPLPWWLTHNRKFYPSYRPKTVTLAVPEYIIKV